MSIKLFTQPAVEGEIPGHAVLISLGSPEYVHLIMVSAISLIRYVDPESRDYIKPTDYVGDSFKEPAEA
jgi:hypothetical protein